MLTPFSTFIGKPPKDSRAFYKQKGPPKLLKKHPGLHWLPFQKVCTNRQRPSHHPCFRAVTSETKHWSRKSTSQTFSGTGRLVFFQWKSASRQRIHRHKSPAGFPSSRPNSSLIFALPPKEPENRSFQRIFPKNPAEASRTSMGQAVKRCLSDRSVFRRR